MGRYYKSPQPVFVDGNIYQPPFEIIVGTLKGIDQDIEANKAALEGARASVLNPDVLEPDRPYVTRKSKEFQGKIDNLTSMVAKDPLGFRNKYSEISELQKDITREYTTGATGKAINQKAYIDDFVKKHTERIEKEKGYVTVEDINWARNYALSKYEENGGLNFNAEKGTYNSISSYLPLALTPTVDLQEIVNEALKGVEAKDTTTHSVGLGNKWITSKIDRSKGYNIDDLKAIANAALNGNQRAWDYLNQQKGFGRWDNRDLDRMIQNAVSVGANSKGYGRVEEHGIKDAQMNPEYKLGLEEAKDKRMADYNKKLEAGGKRPLIVEKELPVNDENVSRVNPGGRINTLKGEIGKLKEGIDSIKDLNEKKIKYDEIQRKEKELRDTRLYYKRVGQAWRDNLAKNYKAYSLTKAQADKLIKEKADPFKYSRKERKVDKRIASNKELKLTDLDFNENKVYNPKSYVPIPENILFNNIADYTDDFLERGLIGDKDGMGYYAKNKKSLSSYTQAIDVSIDINDLNTKYEPAYANDIYRLLKQKGYGKNISTKQEMFEKYPPKTFYYDENGKPVLEIEETKSGSKGYGAKLVTTKITTDDTSFADIMHSYLKDGEDAPNTVTESFEDPGLSSFITAIQGIQVTDYDGQGNLDSGSTYTVDGNTYTVKNIKYSDGGTQYSVTGPNGKTISQFNDEDTGTPIYLNNPRSIGIFFRVIDKKK